MPRQEFTGNQIKDGTIFREDLNTTISGRALVRRILEGTGISITYDGADSGTGDVTINAYVDPGLLIDDSSDSTALVWSSHKTKTSIADLIDDNLISDSFTWSSEEIRAEIDGLIDDYSDSTAQVWSAHKIQEDVLNILLNHMNNLVIHREMNDSIQSATTLWSSERIKQAILANVGGGGTGDATISRDTYADLLDGVAFLNSTYDNFDSTAYIDIINTDMVHDEDEKIYNFAAGEILQSLNIFDSVSGMTTVDKCLISIDYEDTGTPTIQASANGGANWDAVTLNQIHEFSFPGNDLRLKFTGGGSGSVISWAILYNYDDEAVTLIPEPKVFEFTTNLENLQYSGDSIQLTVSENSVGVGASLNMDSSGDLYEAITDSTAFEICQFLALETGTGTKNVLMKGLLRNDVWSWTPGQLIYLSTTSGMLSQTQPSLSGESIQVVGFALTSNIISFNPDKTWITLA